MVMSCPESGASVTWAFGPTGLPLRITVPLSGDSASPATSDFLQPTKHTNAHVAAAQPSRRIISRSPHAGGSFPPLTGHDDVVVRVVDCRPGGGLDDLTDEAAAAIAHADLNAARMVRLRPGWVAIAEVIGLHLKHACCRIV